METVTTPTVPAPGQEFWYESAIHDYAYLFLLAVLVLLLVTAAFVAFNICFLREINRFTSGFVLGRRLVTDALPVVLPPCATAKSNKCTICFSEFQDDECIRALPGCKNTHHFHVSCMDIMLKDHNKCTDCHTLTAEPSGKGKAIEEA